MGYASVSTVSLFIVVTEVPNVEIVRLEGLEPPTFEV